MILSYFATLCKSFSLPFPLLPTAAVEKPDFPPFSSQIAKKYKTFHFCIDKAIRFVLFSSYRVKPMFPPRHRHGHSETNRGKRGLSVRAARSLRRRRQAKKHRADLRADKVQPLIASLFFCFHEAVGSVLPPPISRRGRLSENKQGANA